MRRCPHFSGLSPMVILDLDQDEPLPNWKKFVRKISNHSPYPGRGSTRFHDFSSSPSGLLGTGRRCFGTKKKYQSSQYQKNCVLLNEIKQEESFRLWTKISFIPQIQYEPFLCVVVPRRRHTDGNVISKILSPHSSLFFFKSPLMCYLNHVEPKFAFYLFFQLPRLHLGCFLGELRRMKYSSRSQ